MFACRPAAICKVCPSAGLRACPARPRADGCRRRRALACGAKLTENQCHPSSAPQTVACGPL